MPLSQYQISYNGYTFGPTTEVGITRITGLRSLPAVTPHDIDKLIRPGFFAGRDNMGTRTVTIEFLIVAVADLDAQLTNLETAFNYQQTTSLPLSFQLPQQAQNRRVLARPRQREFIIDPAYSFGYAAGRVQVVCADPRIYNDTATTTALPAGATAVTNIGDFETPPTVTFTNPVSGTTLTNAADGNNFFKFTGTPPATAVVNFDARTVTDGSGVNYYQTVDPTTTWFTLQPGSNSLTLAGGGTASITYRDAWI